MDAKQIATMLLDASTVWANASISHETYTTLQAALWRLARELEIDVEVESFLSEEDSTLLPKN